ncbi:SF1B family DNA helicase RecD2 [Enterococcus sp. LJL98]
MSESLYIVGKVVAIFYQNPSNFYKVILIKIVETNSDCRDDELVVTGSFGEIQEEELYRFFGSFVEHPKYGRQLQVDTYQKEQPTSESGLIQYLSSDQFPGIGKKTAERIIDELGEEAIDRILEDPSVLESIPALNEKRRVTLVETLRLNYGMDQVIVGLNRYGFSSHFSFAIYKCYKNEALEIIEENPYRLVEDIEGIGFKKADQIAEEIGIESTSPQRLRAALLFQVMQQSLQTGHTYVEAQVLLEQALTLLETSRPVEIQPEKLADCVIQLVEEGKIQQEGTRLFENSLYFAEVGIASQIQRLLDGQASLNYPEETLNKLVRKTEKRLGMTYGPSQEVAIKAAISSPLFLLTGGPGTGKTTVINGIVQMFADLHDIELDVKKQTDENFPILLAAPTGRAAKRMNETTGLPSSTIHRLLGLNSHETPSEEGTKELEGALLIVDEMSMVDTWLANTLLKAIPEGMQVILVGDKDQLPSVGPGQVLHDLLEIPTIPKQELTEIYRQGDGSSIIPLAHEIKNGEVPANLLENQKDRSYFRCDAQQIEPIIANIVTKAKEKGFTPQDIQVLAPMYRGVAGINALNQMMQEIFNPNENGKKKEVQFNDVAYRIGDKVLQLQNIPEKNVFNGDMGQIVGITYAKESEDKVDELLIRFDLNEVSYTRNEWQQITLAYCCSIHKAQGSEFKMVILPMVHQYRRMLQRNLLYTAVTRSKELLILLGEPSAYQRSIEQESHIRLTALKERILGEEIAVSVVREEKQEAASSNGRTVKDMPVEIVEETAEAPDYLTIEMVQKAQVDPMIGMENLSPFDFMPVN